MQPGYIYILINPKMPGIAKVGKTTRTPDERALELSGSTGVPSPFIVAFQQPVHDCDAAEAWVHAELERDGYRSAMNREFFDAPLHKIVEIVAKSVDVVDLSIGGPRAEEKLDDDATEDLLAKQLFDLGEAWETGDRNHLPDARKALNLYLQSAALGFCPAYVAAGQLYLSGGRGIKRDLGRALELFVRAVDAGDWVTLSLVARTFIYAGDSAAAAERWVEYFENASAELDSAGGIERSSIGLVGMAGTGYIYSIMRGELTHCVPDSHIAALSQPLIEALKDRIEDLGKDPSSQYPGGAAKTIIGALIRGIDFVASKRAVA
jgi:hypothetical protein